MIDVPALLTSGSAKHCSVDPQLCVSHLPSTHCAKSPPTQASEPSVQNNMNLVYCTGRRRADAPSQESSLVRVANCAFCCCAFWPFESRKLLLELLDAEDDAAEAEATAEVATATAVFAVGVAASEAEASEADAEAEDEEPVELVELSPLPVTPPETPVAAMRAAASASVVQVTEVPALLTRGRAKQLRPDPQLWSVYAPLTHCANSPWTHAFVPSDSRVSNHRMKDSCERHTIARRARGQ